MGPSLGGALAGQWGWHWVFLANVPVAVAGAALGAILLKAGTIKGRQRFDLAGAALMASGLTAILLTLSDGEAWGSDEPGHPGPAGRRYCPAGSVCPAGAARAGADDATLAAAQLRVPANVAFLAAFGRTMAAASILAVVGAFVSFMRPPKQRSAAS